MKRIINNVHLYRPQFDDDPDQIYSIVIENNKIKTIEKGIKDGGAAEILDGHEKTLAASFNDSHLHVLRMGLMKAELDLRQIRTWQETKYEVKMGINHRILNENDWIMGRGLKDNTFKDIDHLLTADKLDEIETDKPLFLLHESGHECVINHKALKIVEHEEELSPDNPFVETDDNDNLTGRFTDIAVHFIKFNYRKKSEEEIRIAVQSAIPYLLKNGITSVQTDDLNFAGSYPRLWKVYRKMEKKDDLPIKVYLHHYVYDIDAIKHFISHNDRRSGDGSDRLRVGAFKIFLDGTQRLHTAAVREPYHDKSGYKGNPIYTQEELNEMVGLADRNGMQVTMHACGDRAVEEAVMAIDQVGSPKIRHRIIHVQTLGPDLLKKIADTHCYVEIQPGSMAGEYDKYEKWFGKKRAPYCNMANSIAQAGIAFTASSDCPVDPLNPPHNISVGVNRTTPQGDPHGGWMPQEKMPIDVAYKAYTETPAWLEYKESSKGRIEKGFAADFILLRNHPKRVSKDRLKDISVAETWIDGERVFKG